MRRSAITRAFIASIAVGLMATGCTSIRQTSATGIVVVTIATLLLYLVGLYLLLRAAGKKSSSAMAPQDPLEGPASDGGHAQSPFRLLHHGHSGTRKDDDRDDFDGGDLTPDAGTPDAGGDSW